MTKLSKTGKNKGLLPLRRRQQPEKLVLPLANVGQKTAPTEEPRRLKVIYKRIVDLKPDPANPRVHSKKQIRQIAYSIEIFGFTVPVLIDRHGNLIAGHCRYLGAQLLGWTEIPTICLEHLTPSQVEAYRIADNQLTLNSQWNDQFLNEKLRDLAAANLDFSLEVTGLDMGEIDLRIETLNPDGLDEEENLDWLQPEPTPAITRLGDLWTLGSHRFLCGDALQEEAYATLMDGKLAAIIISDPPFNVPVNGHVSGLGEIQHREFAMANGDLSRPEFITFLSQVCNNMVAASIDGSLHYICMDWRHCGELLAAGEDAYSELKNICVWAKDNAGMGSLYRSQHEFVFVFKNGTAPHRNNIELGRHGRHRSNVWRYAGMNSAGRGKKNRLLSLHPTVKPVPLIADALLDASERGDIVLDPFLGSGSTLIAAERVGRICYGLELDPLYCDTIIRRWQAASDQEAVLASTGQTFAAVVAERAATAQEVDHDAQIR